MKQAIVKNGLGNLKYWLAGNPPKSEITAALANWKSVLRTLEAERKNAYSSRERLAAQAGAANARDHIRVLEKALKTKNPATTNSPATWKNISGYGLHAWILVSDKGVRLAAVEKVSGGFWAAVSHRFENKSDFRSAAAAKKYAERMVNATAKNPTTAKTKLAGLNAKLAKAKTATERTRIENEMIAYLHSIGIGGKQPKSALRIGDREDEPRGRYGTRNGREKEFQVVIYPANSQSRESKQDLTIYATSKSAAIAKAKADARSMNVNTRNYTFQAFEKYGTRNGGKVLRTYVVPDGERMSDHNAQLLDLYNVGDRIEVWYKDVRYTWEKSGARSWKKISGTPKRSTRNAVANAAKEFVVSFYYPKTDAYPRHVYKVWASNLAGAKAAARLKYAKDHNQIPEVEQWLKQYKIVAEVAKKQTSGGGQDWERSTRNATRTASNAAFKWETRNPNLWVLLYNGELLARLTKNNPTSWTVDVSRGGDRTFRANALSKAKTAALNFARKEFPEFREYKRSQPTVAYVNRIVSKAVKKAHGDVIRIEPTGWGTSEYELIFEDGYSATGKIPKQRNATRTQGAEVADYVLTTPAGKRIRTATKVIFDDGIEIKFIEKLPKREAIRQAEFQRSNRRRNTTPTRSNSGEVFNASKLTELAAMFQGGISGKQIKTIGSDYTPDLTTRLGKLSYMQIKNGKDVYDLKFDGNDAWLGMDARKNLHVVGKDTKIKNAKRPPKGELHLIGTLEQINYITAKQHIENGDLVEYYHKLGEVDGVKPNVFLDQDNFLVINSGNYDIGVFGIEN